MLSDLMKEELTEYEKKLLIQMENAGGRDGLTYALLSGIPCALILGLSIYFKSWIGMVSGTIAYAAIRLWIVIEQDAMSTHVSSAIKKLRKQSQPAGSSDPMA